MAYRIGNAIGNLFILDFGPFFDAVKCNLTKLTTKSAVSVLVSMVSDFWHTSMRMAIVGQWLLVFEHAQTTGMHCSEILLDLDAYNIGKFVFFYFIFFIYLFFPTDPVSVTVAWAWCGGSWLGCRELQAMRALGMFVWGLALEVEAPG